MNQNAHLTTRDLADYLGVTVEVVRQWAHRYPAEMPVRERYGPHRWPMYRLGDAVDVEHATRHGHAA